MSKLAHLKKKAAELEQKRLFEKALSVYEEILQEQGSGEETDVALLNRVGDLYLRQGAVEPALRLYEQAVDLYADRGFLNNAIALCNKILRQDPRRAEIHLRLGRVSARNGFRADARRHFLEYASQLDRVGAMDQALGTLRAIADEGPEFEDVRLMLADLHVARGNVNGAVEQLRLAHDRMELEGRHADAQGALSRILELDPEFQADDLVVLTDGVELDHAAPGHGGATTARSTPAGRHAAASGLVLFEPTDYATPSVRDDVAHVTDDVTGAPDVAAELAAEVDLTADPGPRTAAERLAASLDDQTESVVMPDGLIRGAELDPPLAGGHRARSLTPLDLEPMLDIEEIGDARRPTPPPLSLEGILPTAGVAPSPDDLSAGLIFPDDTVAPSGLEMVDASGEAIFVEPAPGTENPDGDPRVEPDATEPFLIQPDGETFERLELEHVELEHVELEQGGFGASDEEAGQVGLGGSEVEWIEPDRVELHYLDSDPGEAVHPGTVHPIPDQRGAGVIGSDAADTADVTLSGEGFVILDPEPDGGTGPERAATSREDAEGASDGPGEEHGTGPAAPSSLHLDAIEVGSMGLDSREPDSLQAGSLELESLHVGSLELALPETRPSAIGSSGSGTDGADDSYVNLGDWLREDDEPRSTRMVTEERAPSGDEQADFAEMLRKFKQGVADNVDENDHASYYDLGIAYREMGLLDEAIASLQKALRGTRERVRAFEALGQCFLDRGQASVASSVLQRALHEPATDDERLVGVLYLLGRAAEAQNQRTEALGYYQRVFAVDIEFGDVAERIGMADQVSP